MGMESISGVASYQAASSTNATQAAQPANPDNSADSKISQQVTTVSQIASVSEIGQHNNFNDKGNDKNNSNKEREATINDVKNLQKIINNNTVAEFGYNEPTKRITIKIKDKETDEVIKEIPSEKALEMLAKAWELAGILIDEKR